MIPAAKRGNVLLTVLTAAAASGLAAGRAEAQIGIGMGLGGGGFGFYGFGGGYVQQPSNFLNQVALAQMNHVRGPIHNNVYANDPNSYINHLRDNGFVDRYYPDRRDPSYYGYSARPRAQRATPTSATAPSRPNVPLTSFFNDKTQLIWPGDAPMAGDLKEKREASDKACLAVLEETKSNGVASIASVTEARQKLLDYGRPALKDVRARETQRIADGFHVFLLELYDSLAQAANPPAAR